MIRINRLLRLPSNWSHRFGEAGFLSTETTFIRKNSKGKSKSKSKKKVRLMFKKLLLLKRKQKKNIWYEYKNDKSTNKISFVTP